MRFETDDTSFTVSTLSDDESALVNGGNKVVDVIVVRAMVAVVIGLAKAGPAKLV